MRFRVDLDIYRGPLDILLYLVRRHELDVLAVEVSRLAVQYLEHLASIKQVDVDAVGDFLELASTLVEMKSRLVLPSEEEVEEEIDDPRNELVRRLLQFKQYRDVASMLDEQGRAWRQRFPRIANDLPVRRVSPDEQPIHEVELWDLVSAFARLVQERRRADRPENIRYDDTPIHVFMQRIHVRLSESDGVAFHELFAEEAHRSTLVGTFLAVLELLRHGCAQATQTELFGEIWLARGENPLPQLGQLGSEYDHVADRAQAA